MESESIYDLLFFLLKNENINTINVDVEYCGISGSFPITHVFFKESESSLSKLSSKLSKLIEEYNLKNNGRPIFGICTIKLKKNRIILNTECSLNIDYGSDLASEYPNIIEFILEYFSDRGINVYEYEGNIEFQIFKKANKISSSISWPKNVNFDEKFNSKLYSIIDSLFSDLEGFVYVENFSYNLIMDIEIYEGEICHSITVYREWTDEISLIN
jgi:hypothetical protein